MRWATLTVEMSGRLSPNPCPRAMVVGLGWPLGQLLSRPGGPAPHAGDPSRRLRTHAGRPIIVGDLGKTGGAHESSPGRPIVHHAIAPVPIALFVGTARIRAEQDAVVPQGRPQLPQDQRQTLARDMKQGGIGEDPIEALVGKIERQEVLLPDLAGAVGGGHGDETSDRLYAYRPMAEFGKGLKIPPGSAPEIQDRPWAPGAKRREQRGPVLADIMIARGLPEGLRALLVMRKRGVQ